MFLINILRISAFLKAGMCKFEQIFRQNKAENRRFAGGKSRFDNAVLAEKMPKLQVQDFTVKHNCGEL